MCLLIDCSIDGFFTGMSVDILKRRKRSSTSNGEAVGSPKGKFQRPRRSKRFKTPVTTGQGREPRKVTRSTRTKSSYSGKASAHKRIEVKIEDSGEEDLRPNSQSADSDCDESVVCLWDENHVRIFHGDRMQPVLLQRLLRRQQQTGSTSVDFEHGDGVGWTGTIRFFSNPLIYPLKT